MTKEKASEAVTGNVYQRLAAVMRRVKYVQKDASIQMKKGSYKAVTHDAVTAAVRQSLIDCGVIAFPVNMKYEARPDEEMPGWNGQKGATVTVLRVYLDVRFQNVDDANDYIDVPAFADGKDTGDKAAGKAISMAVKYGLLKGLMLETGENEESRVETTRDTGQAENEDDRITPHSEMTGEEVHPPRQAPEGMEATFIPVQPVTSNGEIIGYRWNDWVKAYRKALGAACKTPEPMAAMAEVQVANAGIESAYETWREGMDGGVAALVDLRSNAHAHAMTLTTTTGQMEAAE